METQGHQTSASDEWIRRDILRTFFASQGQARGLPDLAGWSSLELGDVFLSYLGQLPSSLETLLLWPQASTIPAHPSRRSLAFLNHHQSRAATISSREKRPEQPPQTPELPTSA